ncbi:hypothetical protein H4R19_005648, partial [Coemansia spiralis]
LYTLHILPQLGDFPSAYDFLSVSSAVSDPARSEFTKRLDALRNPPPARKPARRTAKRRATKPKVELEPKLGEHTVLAPPTAATTADAPKQVLDRTAPAADDAARHHTRTGSRALLGLAATRHAAKARAVARKPRGAASIAWQVVRRLMSRWGFTLFTLAIAAAVIRLLTQRFRLPQFLAVVYRKLWSTFKMGTQVTYI